MPKTCKISLKKLLLDEANPRIQKVQSQANCIRAIYNDKPDAFKELLSSIIRKGFFQGENILVMPHPEKKGYYIVKEGNRRISALKVLHQAKVLIKEGILQELKHYIAKISKQTLSLTETVPCLSFTSEEIEDLENEIATRHLSGNSPRLEWPPVRKAKKERERTGKYNPALDLLERYLESHPHLIPEWELTYPLTILEDFIKPLSLFLGYNDSAALSMAYPDDATQSTIDNLIEEINNPSADKAIRIVENRRSNAQNFLSERYQKPTTPVSTDKKTSPHDKKSVEALSAIPSKSTPSPNRVPRPKAKDPALELIKEITAISATFSSASIKLYDACKEFFELIKYNKYPIATGILLRSLLDYSLRLACSASGLPVKESSTIGGMLSNIKGYIEDAQLKSIIDSIINSHFDTLHAYVHSPFVTPSKDELRGQITTFLPIIKDLMYIVSEKRAKKQIKETSKPVVN